MSRKINYWRGDIQGKEGTITLDKLGYTDEQWDYLSEDEQRNEVEQYVLMGIRWGYTYDMDFNFICTWWDFIK